MSLKRTLMGFVHAASCTQTRKAPTPEEQVFGEGGVDEQDYRDGLSSYPENDDTEDSTPDLVDLLKGRER